MDAATLYLIAVCAIVGPSSSPCSAPLYPDAYPASVFQRTREDCLRAARKMEDENPKQKVYCVGDDGVSLDAAGHVWNKRAFFEEAARWYEAENRKKLRRR